MAKKCTDVTIKYVTGAERELYAQWKFHDPQTKKVYSNTKSFSYVWLYYAGRWFNGDSGTLEYTASATSLAVTYSPPENTKKVRFKVRPILKGKDKDGKETETIGDWSATAEFTISITNVPTVKLDKEDVTLVKTITDERMIIAASWNRPNTKYYRDGYLESWSYVFRYYKDGTWNEGDAGEVPRDALHKDYEVIAGTKEVKFKIKPNPIGEYFVGGDSSWKSVKISIGERTVSLEESDITKVLQTNGTYEARWTMGAYSEQGITSFNVQWQYFRKNGDWMELQSTTVDVADYIEERTAILNGYAAKTYKLWRTTFDIDASASQFRVRVKPVSNLDNIAYKEVWTDWITIDIEPDPKHVNKRNISYIKKTKNTYKMSWSIGNREDVAGFQYEWAYRYTKGGTRYSGGSGTVNVAEGINVDALTDEKNWNFTVTRPENAKFLLFRAKPVPTYTNSFTGEYQEWYESEISIPSVSVTGARVQVADASTGMLIGSWNRLSSNNYNVDSYEYKWTYSLKTSKNVFISGSTGSVNSNESYTTWTPPDNTHVVTFSVRPKPSYDDEFVGEYSPYTDDTDFNFDTDLPTRSVKNVYMAFQPNTNRTLDGYWQMGNGTQVPSNVASFDYIWRYQMAEKGFWYEGANGNIDSANYVTRDGDQIYWLSSYDYPENAWRVSLSVRPLPSSATAFISQFSEPKTKEWAPTPKTVKNLSIRPYTDLTDRKVYAAWQVDTTVSSLVGSYEIRWAYEVGGKIWYEDVKTEDTVNWYSDPYTMPEETSKVLVAVRPIPTYEQSFRGDWSDYITYSIDVKTVKVYKAGISLVPITDYDPDGDPQTLVCTWTYKYDQPDSYEVEWEYYRGDQNNGVWLPGETDTVAGDAPRLQADYQSPEEADVVHVRIRPVYDNDPTKRVEWSAYVEYKWTIDVLEIETPSLSLQRGTARSIIAAWNAPDSASIDSFEYRWRYTIGGVYFEGSSGTAQADTPACIYDAPETAETVSFMVRAIPVSIRNFVCDWSDEVDFSIPLDNTPETPQTPNVEIVGSKLTATVDTYDTKTSQIEFEIAAISSSNSTEYTTKNVKSYVVLNNATTSINVSTGNKYKVRARGINDEGETGEWSEYSSLALTRPGPVTGTISVEGKSATAAKLEWTIPKGDPESYTVEYTKKERYFDTAPSQVQNVQVSVNAAEILDLQNEEDGWWYFRVKATNSAGDSEWSKVVSIVLGTVPEAPTTWSSTVSATTDRDVYLFWVHNSEDNSRETSAILELTVNGTTTSQTVTKDPNDDTTSYYLIPANQYSVGASIRWRVKTKGAVADYGEWSVSREVTIYAPPVLNLIFSGGFSNGRMTTYPIAITMEATPLSQTPIGYSVSVISNDSYEAADMTGINRTISAGQTIFNKYYISSDNTYSIELTPGDVSLVNSTSYTLRVSVSMNSGLSDVAEHYFTTSWKDDEYDISASVGIDEENLVAYITPTCDTLTGATVSDVIMSVFRREFDGTFTPIMTGIATNNTTVVDPHPALDYARYRIVAQSSLTGKIEYYDTPGYLIGETSLVLQWDEAWTSFDVYNGDALAESPYSGSVLKLPFNVKIADSNTIDSNLVEYIGRKHPVSYYGTQVGQKLTLNTDIALTDSETIYALRRLAVWMGDVYVREPSGSGYWAKVDVSFSQTRTEVTIPVTLNVTRVEGGA